MNFLFEKIVDSLVRIIEHNGSPNPIFSAERVSNMDRDSIQTCRSINRAFLAALCGNQRTEHQDAVNFLEGKGKHNRWGGLSRFYLNGLARIHSEIDQAYSTDRDFARRMEHLADWCTKKEEPSNNLATADMFWDLFFPEGKGIWEDKNERVDSLREARKVRISASNPSPITDPLRQILFTSNALLTLPAGGELIQGLAENGRINQKLEEIAREPQKYWYDHPVQIGVEPGKNEILYGLRGLQEAVDFDIQRSALERDQKLTCVLSVSVTHDGLAQIAREYIEGELAKTNRFRNLNLFVFTEADTKELVDKILSPAAGHYMAAPIDITDFEVFGVNGSYGRHYSFLKAISAFWSILIDPSIKATFKIDLDQVFPQRELLRETGLSAFDHFKTPLWGAHGIDSKGNQVELGMIAGALVNEADIQKSLFTPDVQYPDLERKFAPDELVFYSQLPQALSTEAEMMARYNTGALDGIKSCLQRVHVTGGTNGILVDSLRRGRTFTPTFIGRAEDQAYILSNHLSAPPGLVYLHKDGLIMRHDKEALAQEAIQAAQIGKLVGDYVRILYFSAYARVLGDLSEIKKHFDPFTGCFISPIPVTLTLLRFSLKVESFFSNGHDTEGFEFTRLGAERLAEALDFCFSQNNQLENTLRREQADWNLFFDTLEKIERGLVEGDPFAVNLQASAKALVDKCTLET